MPRKSEESRVLISGSCHCANISFVLEWRPEPAEIPARACTCSFCTRHGGVWTSCPTGSLTVRLCDSSLASAYSFGTKTADFHVCMRCGVVPVVSCRLDDKLYAVVNVNTFEGVPAEKLQHSPASFDGEDESSRLARRQRNWIPDVEFTHA